jgi:lactoylglutathione lyase
MAEVYATRLLVRNFAATYRFYHDRLGLKPRFGSGEPPYAELFGGERLIALFERDRMAASLPAGLAMGTGGDAVLLGFEVTSVDAEYDRLRALGVPFEAPPTDRPAWSLRTTHLRDPEGNLVELFENRSTPGPGPAPGGDSSPVGTGVPES